MRLVRGLVKALMVFVIGVAIGYGLAKASAESTA